MDSVRVWPVAVAEFVSSIRILTFVVVVKVRTTVRVSLVTT